MTVQEAKERIQELFADLEGEAPPDRLTVLANCFQLREVIIQSLTFLNGLRDPRNAAQFTDGELLQVNSCLREMAVSLRTLLLQFVAKARSEGHTLAV